MNRGLEGVETAQRALSMLPDDDTSEERAALLAWLARTRFLRGRFRDALEDAEEARAAAIAAGDRCGEGEVLNTLGMTQVALGQVDEGVARAPSSDRRSGARSTTSTAWATHTPTWPTC